MLLSRDSEPDGAASMMSSSSQYIAHQIPVPINGLNRGLEKIPVATTIVRELRPTTGLGEPQCTTVPSASH